MDEAHIVLIAWGFLFFFFGTLLLGYRAGWKARDDETKEKAA